MDTPVDDRALCECLFGIAPASRHRLDAEVRRLLVRQLDSGRPAGVELEKHSRAAAVRIPVGPAVLSPACLPAGIFFEPGRLTVDYGSVEELLRRFYELAQAAANDFDEFSKLAMSTVP